MTTRRYTTEQLRLTFIYDVVQKIAAADEQLMRQEVGLLELFSPRLIEAGLMAADGTLHAEWDDTLAQSHDLLPSALDELGKLEVLATFRDACTVDGELDLREGAVMLQAATALGISAEAYLDHLAHLEVG